MNWVGWIVIFIGLGTIDANRWIRTQIRIYQIQPIKQLKKNTSYFINDMIIKWYRLAEDDRELIKFIVESSMT